MSSLPPTEHTTTDDDADFQAAIAAIFEQQGVDPVPEGVAPPVELVDPNADTGVPAPVAAPDAAPSSASGDLEPDPADADDEDIVEDPTANLVDLGDGLVADREQLAELLNWSNSLTPEEAAAVRRALENPAASGSGHPAPAPGHGQALPGAGGAPQYAPQQYAPQYPQYPAPAPQPAPYQYPAAGQPGMPVSPQQAAGHVDPRQLLGPLEELTPGLGDYLAQLQYQQQQQSQALAAYQAQQADLSARAARDEQARREAQITAGHEAFKQSHPDLTDVDLHYLASRAADLQVMAGLTHRLNGDVTAAYQEALTTAMYSDPVYRDKAIQTQVDQFAQSQTALEQRRADAASLSGSGGSVPRSPQPAPAEMTPDARRAAMAQFIAQAANS